MIKVMVSTPMYGGMCMAGYANSMINLMKKSASHNDIEIEFMYGTNEALITKARNICSNIFLKSDCTHLLFIDSDIEFDADEVIKMLKTDEDFVCGIYPKKKLDWNKIYHSIKSGQNVATIKSQGNEYLFEPSTNTEINEKGLVEIERAGTGMMLISRNVFEKLKDKVGSFLQQEILSNVQFDEKELCKEYFFTSVDAEKRIFLHEDFNFCKLWRDNGGKIYGAPWVRLYHIGNYTFG